ncbi:MAG: glycosyltransferase, partial [bacterium]
MYTLKNEHILCVTVSDWDEPKRCRHHLVRLLAENNQVVWVEKTISFNDFSLKKISRFLRFIRPPRRVKDNLTVLTPPPAVPLLDKLPYLEYVNDFILLLFIKRNLKKLGFDTTVFWSFSCYAEFLVGKFRERFSIYYCNDPFNAWDKSRRILKEKKLCRKVDLLLTPSKYLTEEKKKLNANTHTLLHGVDTAVYLKDHGIPPEDISGIPHPIIGYSGPVREIVDIELIRFLAGERPGWSIVLIGPVVEMSQSARKKWEALKEPNIYLLGEKEVDTLPAYLKETDVDIFPYSTAFFEEYHYCQIPLKYFEYLSMGKPIVSTAYSRYEGTLEGFHETADDYRDFLDKI